MEEKESLVASGAKVDIGQPSSQSSSIPSLFCDEYLDDGEDDTIAEEQEVASTEGQEEVGEEVVDDQEMDADDSQQEPSEQQDNNEDSQDAGDGDNNDSQDVDDSQKDQQNEADQDESQEAIEDNNDDEGEYEEDFDPDTVVPETAFWHIEAANDNGFKMNEIVELEHSSGYWYARIVGNFGRMVSLSWITLKDEDDSGQTKKILATASTSFFFDLDNPKNRFYCVGYFCRLENKVKLSIPSEIQSLVNEQDISAIERQVRDEDRKVFGKTISTKNCQVYEDGGLNPSNIHPGTKLRVCLEDLPCYYWWAVVEKNIGGRLLLSWGQPKSSTEELQPLPSFWLFYTHPRLTCLLDGYSGHASCCRWWFRAHSPWDLSKKKEGNSSERFFLDDVCNESDYTPDQEGFPEDMRPFKDPSPIKYALESEWRPFLYVDHQPDYKPIFTEIVGHVVLTFPSSLLKLVPATVKYVCRSWHGRQLLPGGPAPKSFNEEWRELVAKITFKSDEKEGDEASKELSFWIPFDDTKCILPLNWGEENDIPIDGNIDVRQLPKTNLTLRDDPRISQFKLNGRIEVVHPDDPDKICEAIIIRVTPPLIWSQISAEKIVVLPYTSTNMFPSGWCETHGYPLTKMLPKAEKMKKKSKESEEKEAAAIGGDYDSNPPSVPESLSLALEPTSKAWCPRIYFNYKCFSGPSLSKSKLCNLPRFVGPGPVLLVMQEVISKILSIAYVPSRVLNELSSESFAELLDEHKIYRTQPVEFKAKYSTSGKLTRQEVPIIRTSERIEDFCRLICSHIKCCFNLFGPNLYDGDNCPSNCRGLTKSNKILKRADFFRQQAVAAKNYLSGNVATFDAIYKSIDAVKSGGGKRGRGGRRPIGDRQPKEAKAVLDDDQRSSNSGSGNEESQRKKAKFDDPKKPKGAKKLHKGLERVYNDLNQDDTSQSSIRTDEGEDENEGALPSTHQYLQPNGSGSKGNAGRTVHVDHRRTSSNPLNWDVNQVYEYIMRSECSKFAPHLKDHEVDGAALLLLDLDVIAQIFLNSIYLFNEKDVLRLNNLITRLRMSWSRHYRS